MELTLLTTSLFAGMPDFVSSIMSINVLSCYYLTTAIPLSLFFYLLFTILFAFGSLAFLFPKIFYSSLVSSSLLFLLFSFDLLFTLPFDGIYMH